MIPVFGLLAMLLAALLALESRHRSATAFRWHAAILLAAGALGAGVGVEPAASLLASYGATLVLCAPGASSRSIRASGSIVLAAVPAWTLAAITPSWVLVPAAGTWLLFHLAFVLFAPAEVPVPATALDLGAIAVALSPRGLFLLPDGLIVVLGSLFALFALGLRPPSSSESPFGPAARFAFALLLAAKLLAGDVRWVREPALIVAALVAFEAAALRAKPQA